MSKSNKLKVRHWALSSHGALKGKTTFIASNCRAPIVVVDTDGRFDAVEALVNGEVFYPSQVIDPLTLAEELMEFCAGGKIKSIAFDSLTKLYSIHARMAYMRNMAGGSNKNRAAEMVHKANAMTIARDMAMLGTDMYYSWHTMEGVDGQGKSEIRAMISDVERSRLQTSINATLEFIEEGGRYGVRVATARDFGGRPANIGFTYWDEPGNYWRGAADRLEELIYTSFSGKDEAIRWTARELGIEIDEAGGVYEYVKDAANPKDTSSMWVALVTEVHELSQARSHNSQEKVTTQKVDESIGVDSSPPAARVPPPPPPNEELFEGGELPFPESKFSQMKKYLEEIAEKRADGTILLGQVVYAVLEAVPDRFGDADEVRHALGDYPGLPDGYTWELEKIVTVGGALKFFDYVAGPPLPPDA